MDEDIPEPAHTIGNKRRRQDPRSRTCDYPGFGGRIEQHPQVKR
jgi:hypothetical protein